MTSNCGDPKDKVEKMPKVFIALRHDKKIVKNDHCLKAQCYAPLVILLLCCFMIIYFNLT